MLPGAEMTEAQFLTEIVERSDCGLLLDITNLYINSVNHDNDICSFLEQLPLEQVVQLHFVGGHWHDGVLIDRVLRRVQASELLGQNPLSQKLAPLNSIYRGTARQGIFIPVKSWFWRLAAGIMNCIHGVIRFIIKNSSARRTRTQERFLGTGDSRNRAKSERICLLNPLQRRSGSPSLKMLAESVWRGLNLRRSSLVKRHWGKNSLRSTHGECQSHSHSTPQEIWKLMDEVVSRAPVKGFVLERDENLPPFSQLAAELEHARAIGRQYHRWN